MAAKKLRADELGIETEIPLDEEMDVGVLGQDGKPLLLERRRLRTRRDHRGAAGDRPDPARRASIP